jgi:quercetin dioxygenase-like cupin family protein
MGPAWGNPARGPHGAFHKFTAGFEAPLHSHSASTKVVVVSGTMVFTPEGGQAKEMGPGSWGSFPGGAKHITSCKAGADCLIFVVASGKFNVKMAKKPAEKKGETKEEPKAEEKK